MCATQSSEINLLTPQKIDINFGMIKSFTLGDCIKELIDGSYQIYSDLLQHDYPITLVCGGQSPAYYCLAMLNFKIYNPSKVNIIIIPHSKGGEKSLDQINENIEYCKRLRGKNITLFDNVVILDGVHSGVGILALESALKYCYPNIKVQKIGINVHAGISKIKLNKEYYFRCEPKFSDIFPRLVNSFHPRDFNDSSKFITTFNINDNLLAKVIISLSKKYPEIPVENSEWYKLNNEVTEEIKLLRKYNDTFIPENELEILLSQKSNNKEKLDFLNYLFEKSLIRTHIFKRIENKLIEFDGPKLPTLKKDRTLTSEADLKYLKSLTSNKLLKPVNPDIYKKKYLLYKYKYLSLKNNL